MKTPLNPTNARHQITCASLAIFAAASLFNPLVAQATDYYWDADGDNTTTIGGTGNWDNTSPPSGGSAALPAI